MGTKIKLKEIFEAQAQFGAFYTGGSIAWSPDGTRLYCQDGAQINIVDVDTVSVISTIGSSEENLEGDLIYRFALSPDGTTLVSAHKSGLLKMWDAETGIQRKLWKSLHSGPIASLVFSPNSKEMASGGSDSVIRLWDAELQVCKGTLRGSQGVVSLLAYHPSGEFVVGSGSDAKINCWDVQSKKVVKQFTSHFSSVTSVAFKDSFMVSSGRDKVLVLWDFEKSKHIRTIPVYEAVEEVVILPEVEKLPNGIAAEGLCVLTAGEEGVLKVWEMHNSRILFKQEDSLVAKSSEEGGLAITYLLQNLERNQVAVVSVEQNIIIHDLESFKCVKQIVGFSDEILDLAVFNKDRNLAMVTNSNDLKLYDLKTMNCQLLRGHSDTVLAVAAHKSTLISASKDCSVKVWKVLGDSVVCLGTGKRHTSAVGAVDLSRSQDFFASASQDKCLKVWKIPAEVSSDPLVCLGTALAHEKDINSLAISPNDKIIATGSQDKTAKLWDAETLALLGSLRGHKKGIWSVTFSRTDQVIMTTAADCTIRLWNLADYSCLKSFEGHESSVLRAEFLTESMQIISTGADGLVKLWNVKTSECMQTLDKHDSRIWALALSGDESVVYSGGADSKLILWKDVTAEKRDEEIKKAQETALLEQELSNLIHQKKMLKALKMALKLDRPFTSLKIINSIIKDQEKLESTVLGLNQDLKESLLRHAVNWNTNSRNCRPAQLVINILLPEIVSKKLQVTGLGKLLEEVLPYTERHFNRMTEYLKDVKFIEYTLRNMQPHLQEIEMTAEVKMEEDSD